MKFFGLIDYRACLAWDMNLSQAHLFAFIYDAAAWAERDETGQWWYLSRGKIIHELPAVVRRVDTVYRLANQLIELGLIERNKINKKEFYRIARKGFDWNSDAFSSESLKKISDDDIDLDGGKKFESQGDNNFSEKNTKNGPDVTAISSICGQNDSSSTLCSPSDRTSFPEDFTGKESNVLVYNLISHNKFISQASERHSGNGELLTESWRPSDQIKNYCFQLGVISENEFILAVTDYRNFWLGPDGCSREVPRSWSSNFKNRFAKILNSIRRDRSSLEVRVRDRSIEQGLNDFSWAN